MWTNEKGRIAAAFSFASSRGSTRFYIALFIRQNDLNPAVALTAGWSSVGRNRILLAIAARGAAVALAAHTHQCLLDGLGAAFFKEYPERKAESEGFTDSTGGDEYNQKLSERREFFQAALG